MLYLSKSKYCAFWQCPKILWLQKYRPEEIVTDNSTTSHMEEGNEVGDLAMGLFGDYVEVTSYIGEELDIPAMIDKTKDEMAKGTPVICEAAFEYNVSVSFRCKRYLTGEVIDWFGAGVKFSDATEDEMIVTVDVNENSMFYWLMQYGQHVEVLEPQMLRDRIKNTVTEIVEKYK